MRPPAPALPAEPREYQDFWRTPGVPMWKPFVIVLLGAVGFFLIAMVVSLAAMLVDASVAPGGLVEVMDDLLDGEVSKLLFIANSLALGLMIPLALLLQKFTRQPAGFLHSVVGRVRWRWLLTCFGVSFAAVAVLTLVDASLVGWENLGLSPQPGWLLLLAAILVVTPFQAAGEEYLVRGALLRAVASVIPSRWAGLAAGAAVSSFVFMLMHGAADPWLNAVYFCMGLLFCHLTWRTGGLEAAVAMHAANNLLGLGFVPFQEWGGLFDRSAGVAGPSVLLQLLLLGLAAAAIEFLARRRGLTTTSAPAAHRAVGS